MSHGGPHPGTMHLLEHFVELRKRVLLTLTGLVVGICTSYLFTERLLLMLRSPMERSLPAGQKLVFLTVTEPLYTHFLLAVISGIVLSAPWTFYQFWRFVAPGLRPTERRLTVPFVLAASAWFLLGVVFAFTVFLPFSFQFFLSMADEELAPMISLFTYTTFSLQMLCVFGFLFELPVISFFLARIGLVNAKLLRSSRRAAIVLCFVVGAIFTPPDPASQMMLAIPMVLLYEVGILAAALAERGGGVTPLTLPGSESWLAPRGSNRAPILSYTPPAEEPLPSAGPLFSAASRPGSAASEADSASADQSLPANTDSGGTPEEG